MKTLRYYTICLALALLSCGRSNNQNPAKENKTNNTQAQEDNKKYNYNIYIENSESMFGYVNGNTEFKDVLVRFISDIVNNNLNNKLSLSFINDTICPQQTSKNNPLEIQYFVQNLKPVNLQNTSCTNNTSYLPNILEKSIKTNPQDVNILISDCVFSSDKGSSTRYLSIAKETVRTLLHKQIETNNIATVVYKFKSSFFGKYFVESNNGQTIDIPGTQRPYYVIITGPSASVNQFLTKIKVAETREYKNYQNSFYLLTPNSSKPASKILINNNKKEGNYNLSKNAKDLIINNAKPFIDPETKESKFVFKVASNLSFVKADESYITNVSNYEITKDFKIESIVKITDTSNIITKGFDHIITLSSNKLNQTQTVQIKLKTKTPNWVAETGTEDDGNPDEVHTFGFSYLMEGVSQAYNDVYNGKDQFVIEIQVNKGDSANSSKISMPWILLIIAVVLFAGIIILKNKK